MDERDLPAAPRAGATPAERAAFGQASGSRSAGQDGRGQPTGSTQPAGSRQGGSGDGSDGTAGAASNAAGRATDLARDAFDSAAGAASSIRDRVASSAQEQQGNAADKVESLADSLRRTADSLPDDQAWLSDLTVRGGQQLSDLADTLRRNDLQGLLRKADGFARSQPALFLGASMAAGFALARVAQVSVAQMANNSSSGQAGGAYANRSGSSTQAATPRPTVRTTVTEGPNDRATYAATGERRDGDNTEMTHG